MKFIAHRGYSKLFPENTLEAFKASLEHPESKNLIIGIELDIQMTKDGRIAVFHDTQVKNPEGEDVNVCDISFDELKEFSKEKLKGNEPPEMKDAFNLTDHKTSLYIEIKDAPYDKDELCEKFVKLLEEYAPENDIVIHSFSSEIMRKIIKLTSGMKLKYGFLCSSLENFKGLGENFLQKIDFIHPSHKFFLEEQKFLGQLKRSFHIWTVNTEETLQDIINSELHDMVNAVITDDLSLTEIKKG
jgi:glycerophosphoryl diester phosphodiesterase